MSEVKEFVIKFIAAQDRKRIEHNDRLFSGSELAREMAQMANDWTNPTNT